MKRFMFRVLAACLFITIAAVPLSNASAQQASNLTDIGSVASFRDGRTLLPADGRELRLAAVEVPGNSRGALQSLVSDRELQMKQLSPELDRYRRLVVFAYAGDSQQPVQQTLLEQGRARALARVGNKACADLLLAAEHAARTARLGLWADPNFAPLRPENPERVAAARGQFALVEGKVLSARESGATIYLNFGRRRTHEFTVTILKRHRRAFATAGIDPKRLEGSPIRVRGWIEQRHGPVIEAATPEQMSSLSEGTL